MYSYECSTYAKKKKIYFNRLYKVNDDLKLYIFNINY